ncbi:MAG: phage major capsid protein, partial [Proteobacteria bacterium]|nr:phage major capsid protein [Pseudomonadota bacterium]
IDDLNKAFADFKVENDTRLKEVENKDHADPVLTEKVEKIAKDIADIEVMRQQLDAIENSVAAIQVPGGGSDKEKPIYASIGEQLLDVITMGTPGNPNRTDCVAAMERLGKVQAAASGANETVPEEGGFLVGTDEATMLDRGAVSTGLLSQRCFNVTASGDSDSLKLNLIDESSRANGSRFGGIQVYMKAEADTVTATKPKFREAVWDLNDCMGIMYATKNLLKDAGKLTTVVNKWFPMEFGFKIDDLIVNGTGAGMPLGIVGAGCTVTQAVETGQVRSSTKIKYENIAHMYARLLSSSDPNAVWFVNRALLPYIMLMTIPVGTGGAPVFLPPNGAAGQPYMTLLNKPIIPIEQCQAPGTAGDIILADLNEYLLLTKGGIEASSSIHVRFIYDEMTLKWVYRLDGAPLRNKTLTPFKGSDTLGPFVVLAAS